LRRSALARGRIARKAGKLPKIAARTGRLTGDIRDRTRGEELAERRVERQTPPIFSDRIPPARVCAEMSFDAQTAAPFLL
jgi:hypothetical protein